MGKIGDLWVRLGLKKDEYSAGLKQAEKEAGGFGKSVVSITGKAKIAFAAVAAAVVGVYNAVKELAKQNQVLGDAWNRTAAGMTAAWDTFKTSLANTDFTHLFSNMREAARYARELYDAQDAMGEIGTAYAISSSEQLEKINELRVALQNANLTDEERIAKGRELLAIYEKLEQDPTRGLANVKDATLDKYLQKMGLLVDGLTDEEMVVRRKKFVEFFKWLGTEQGEYYNNEAKQIAGLVMREKSLKGIEFMNRANAAGVGEFAQYAINYNAFMGNKDLDAVREAVVAYNSQVAKYGTETRRIQTLINSVEASGSGKPGGTTGTPQRVDILQQEVDLLRQELAEEQQIAAADDEMEQQAWADYKRWRDLNGFNAQPIGLDNDELLLFSQALQEVINYENELADVTDMLNANQDELNQHLIANLENLGKVSEDVAKSITEQLVSAIEEGLVGSFNTLANVIAGVSDGGMENVVKALLEPLADMAIKAGTLIMMSGTAIEALKESLIGFFGGSAVIAGGALIAVGIAAKAGLAAIGNKGAAATSVSHYGSASSSMGYSGGISSAELTVNVVGTVKGSDIILAGQNTINSWSR